MATPVHELKTTRPMFDAICNGGKRFEVRKDDRGFQPGDTLKLREYHIIDSRYTGRELEVRVAYVLRAHEIPGKPLEAGYVVMGFE